MSGDETPAVDLVLGVLMEIAADGGATSEAEILGAFGGAPLPGYARVTPAAVRFAFVRARRLGLLRRGGIASVEIAGRRPPVRVRLWVGVPAEPQEAA